jgi:hypothetical protein
MSLFYWADELTWFYINYLGVFLLLIFYPSICSMSLFLEQEWTLISFLVILSIFYGVPLFYHLL